MRTPDPDLVWRVKGSFHLAPAALAILREIWYWREKEAVASNRPPYFILQPDTMLAMSIAAVEGRSVENLIPKRFSPRRHATLVKAVQRGLHAQDKPQPIRAAHYRQTADEKRRYHELEKKRNRRATDLGIDPTVIASRSDLVQLARNGNGTAAELMQWQSELLK